MSTLIANKPSITKEPEESLPHMNQLFKPLVINQRIVRRSESDITTTSTTLPLSSLNTDQNIPLIYPQFQLGVIPNMNNKRPINPAFLYPNENKNKKIVDMKNKPCCSCNTIRPNALKNIVNALPIINYVQIVFVSIAETKIYLLTPLELMLKKKIRQKISLFAPVPNQDAIKNIVNALKKVLNAILNVDALIA